MGCHAQHCGLFRELGSFLGRAVASEKWRKWVYGSPSESLRALTAGHYAFGTDEYRELVAQLGRRTDVNAAIHATMTSILERYAGGMQ